MLKIIKIKAFIKVIYVYTIFLYIIYSMMFIYILLIYICANKTKSQYKFYSFI